MTVVGDQVANLNDASSMATLRATNQTQTATNNRIGRLMVSMSGGYLFAFIGGDAEGGLGASQWRDISPAAFRGPYNTEGIDHNWNDVVDLVDPDAVAFPFSEGYFGKSTLIGTSSDYGSFVRHNGLLFLAAYDDGIWSFNGTTWFREHMWSGQDFSHVFVWNDELWAVSDGSPGGGSPALSPQTTGWTGAFPFTHTNYFWRRNSDRTWTVIHRFKGGYADGENLPHPFMDTPPLTFLDSSGNGRTASWSGGDPTNVVGKPGLVSGDTCVEWGPGGGLIPTDLNFTGDFTIETWVQGLSGNGIDGHFFTARWASGVIAHLDCSFETVDQTVRFWYGDPQTLATSTVGVPADNNPHHIVATLAGGTPHIYIDGVEVTIIDFGPTGPHSSFPATITMGRTQSGPAIRQDETAMYEYALSAGRVAAHYADRSSFSAYSPAVIGDGPAAYYHLNDVVGPPVEDFDQAREEDQTIMTRPQQLLITTIGGQDVILIGDDGLDKWGAYGPGYGDHPVDDWSGSCAYTMATYQGFTWSFEFDSIVFRSSDLSSGFDKLQVLVDDDTRPADMAPEYPFPLKPGYTQGDMWCCVEANGRLYVGDGNGQDAADNQNHCHLWVVRDDLSGVEFVAETGVVDGCFNAMAADSAGRVYAGTSFGLLYRYNGSTLDLFTNFGSEGLSPYEQINWIGGIDLNSGTTTVGDQTATLTARETA